MFFERFRRPQNPENILDVPAKRKIIDEVVTLLSRVPDVQKIVLGYIEKRGRRTGTTIIAVTGREYKGNDVTNVFATFTEFYPNSSDLGVGLVTTPASKYDEGRGDIQLWPPKVS